VRLPSTSMRGLGLVATQTLMLFLFADVEGSAAMGQRLGDAYAADRHRLIRAALAVHGG
jgi:hypothetical protein